MRNIAFLLLLLTLLGCSASKKGLPMEISTFTLYETVSFEETVQKAYYHPGTKTLYALLAGNQEIEFWRDGKRQNTIGGMGSLSTNFRSLADFAMAQDGNIFVLDSVAKIVKKFNPDGKMIGEMELSYVQQPTKMALGNNQNIFIYDAAGSEIIAYDLLEGSELYRFGKFELSHVDMLYANKDYVVAYDNNKAENTLFSSLGQKIAVDSGQLVYDTYNNAIGLNNESLISKMSAAWLPMTGEMGLMTICGDTIAIVVGKQVRLLKLDYAEVL
ncbi:MAG: hypothetical protein WCY87_01460 [Candidatus Cloacimonadales bacterium]|jgi:hypothetical protein|nr:hypothetical protein [Candidatus Cloacimonadota bacterium]MDY0381055.1 hypothetical protein [Candidatus Cloacimonadaceae bacterium]MCB5256213.1 hypothetical protein [Candidatus Cloacimonadota bacterium]MCB5264208.1 hypothetical protein [Candidatus Cloacimonadota bacterium]MCB5276686.1 hypothetical protein [Candidatus Cloacimonadota bacterium]